MNMLKKIGEHVGYVVLGFVVLIVSALIFIGIAALGMLNALKLVVFGIIIVSISWILGYLVVDSYNTYKRFKK